MTQFSLSSVSECHQDTSEVDVASYINILSVGMQRGFYVSVSRWLINANRNSQGNLNESSVLFFNKLICLDCSYCCSYIVLRLILRPPEKIVSGNLKIFSLGPSHSACRHSDEGPSRDIVASVQYLMETPVYDDITPTNEHERHIKAREADARGGRIAAS